MTAQELETSINKGNIPAICYLYGEELFLVERAVKLLLDSAIDHSLKDFNFNCFFGNESNGVDIIDAAQTLPMFADRRVVLVKRAEALKADATEILIRYIQNPSPSTCLIFSGVKIDQRKKFFLELKKHAVLVEYKKLYENKLGAFILHEAVLQGKKIESAAADLLAFLIGNNLLELSSQIEKLVAYTGEHPRITVEDVKAIASSSKEFTAFELAKYLGCRDLMNSIRSLNALFENGEDAPIMIGALSRHFRQLWKIREMLDNKASQSDIGREVGINPFFLGEMVQQAKKFRCNELRRIFDELYRCDVGSKTGGQPYTLMHSLVFSICGGRV